jgi:hypothetical protein
MRKMVSDKRKEARWNVVFCTVIDFSGALIPGIGDTVARIIIWKLAIVAGNLRYSLFIWDLKRRTCPRFLPWRSSTCFFAC